MIVCGINTERSFANSTAISRSDTRSHYRTIGLERERAFSPAGTSDQNFRPSFAPLFTLQTQLSPPPIPSPLAISRTDQTFQSESISDRCFASKVEVISMEYN